MPLLSYLPDTRGPTHSAGSAAICACHGARRNSNERESPMRIRTSARRFGRLGAGVLLAGGMLCFILMQPATTAVGQVAAASAGNKPGYTDDFAKLGFKFEGASTCSNVKCHGADEPKEGAGATTLAEFTQWSGGDLHAKAHEQLAEEASTKIAEALKIEATDARCLSCHSTNAPEKQ